MSSKGRKNNRPSGRHASMRYGVYVCTMGDGQSAERGKKAGMSTDRERGEGARWSLSRRPETGLLGAPHKLGQRSTADSLRVQLHEDIRGSSSGGYSLCACRPFAREYVRRNPSVRIFLLPLAAAYYTSARARKKRHAPHTPLPLSDGPGLQEVAQPARACAPSSRNRTPRRRSRR